MPGVHGPRPAEGEERIGAEVLAALDAVHARGARHVFVHHAVDAPRRVGQREPHGAGHRRFHRLLRRVHVETHAAAEEEARIEIAQEKIGVGDRGHLPALRIAGGAGIGARAVRSHLEEAHAIDAGQRSAARPDLDQLDAGHADGEAGALLEPVGACDLELAGEEWLAAVDDAGLGGGAAHVEGEEPGLAELARHARGGQRARRRTRLHEANGHALRRLRRGHASRRQHDVEAPGYAEVLELALEIVEIAGHEGHDVDIGAGGRRALVLPDLRHHLRRGGHGHPGRELGAHVLQRALVDGVAVRVEETDSYRLYPCLLEPGDGGPCRSRIEGREHAAPRHDALLHLEAQVAGHEGRRLIDEEVVHVVAALAADLHRVAKTRGGEQPCPRALALDERVRR